MDKLKPQLRRDEGEVLHAYRDTLGFWTIGVGILIDPAKGATPPAEMTWPDGRGVITEKCRISKEVSDRLLDDHIEVKTAHLIRRAPWVAQLDDARRGVLINMAFNLGVDGLLGFPKTLRLVQGGNYTAAAVEMLKSKWAKQVGARATRLAKQMETGEWQ